MPQSGRSDDMRINRFTKVCFVLLVMVGGLLAFNWPFQPSKPTHAMGVIHPVHTAVSHGDIVSGILSSGGALVIGVVLIVVIIALIRVRKGQ